MPTSGTPGPQVTVLLPAALVQLFPGSTSRVALSAATVAEAISALDMRWPGMRDRLCDTRPGIRRHINVFAAGRRANLGTPLQPGMEVEIITAMLG